MPRKSGQIFDFDFNETTSHSHRIQMESVMPEIVEEDDDDDDDTPEERESSMGLWLYGSME